MNNPAAVKLHCMSAAMIFLALEPLCAATLLSGPGAGFNTQTSTGTDGYGFTVGSSSLLVTALGIWDSLEPTPNGLDEAHDVSIWTTDGVLLGRVNVPSGTAGALDGQFRYASLSAPLILAAGQTYVLGAYYPTSLDWFRGNSASQGDAILSSSATFGGSWSGPGTGFPFRDSGDVMWVGPNLEFIIVPEPSCGLHVVMGTAGLVMYGARRQSLTQKAAYQPLLKDA